ncbi:MAG: hypothetical protein ACE5PT_08765, partial [Gemmatimonadales bacterium]
MRPTFLPLAAAAIVACGGSHGELVVEASLEGYPLGEFEITALPFDPDRILDSLSRLAPHSRPEFDEL